MATIPPSWCHDMVPSSTIHLQESALTFLDILNLPYVHPTCIDGHDFYSSTKMAPQDLRNEDASFLSLDFSISSILTMYWNIVPPLLAMGELWLRLFAIIVAPLSILYWVTQEVRLWTSPPSVSASSLSKPSMLESIILLLGLASSAVLLTDSMYVYEYGRSFGLNWFGWMLVFLFRSLQKKQYIQQKPKPFFFLNRLCSILTILIPLWTIFLCVVEDFRLFPSYVSSPSSSLLFENPGVGLDLPTFDAGFYFDETNPIMSSIKDEWPEHKRQYQVRPLMSNNDSSENVEVLGATPYLITGDSRTGIPFLVNDSDLLKDGVRVWVKSEVMGEENEANAVDIFFPLDGVHREEYPMYLVLHGLNGGSDEEYIKDFVRRRRKEGSTVAVLIARGLMNTPVFGWNAFHGARISDVHTTSKHFQRTIQLQTQRKNTNKPSQTLAGAGYSMGAIIISNYVARSGSDCALDAAVAISGGLYMTEQMFFF